MGRKLKIGDLFEVPTPKGLGYIQFCHREAKGPSDQGPLIRAIEGLYEERPADLEEVAQKPLLFWTYYPLGAALYHKLVSYVGNFAIPKDAAIFPLLRSYNGPDRTGLVHGWNILRHTSDLQEEILYRVQILSEEEQAFSDSTITMHPTLVERIQEQYRPEMNPIMRRAQRHWIEVARKEKGRGAEESAADLAPEDCGDDLASEPR